MTLKSKRDTLKENLPELRRISFMSSSTATPVFNSPALSFRSHSSYARSPGSGRTRPPTKRSRSSILSFINPWGHHHHHVDDTPRSRQRRLPQPIANSLLEYRQVSPIEYDLSLNPSHILVVHRHGYSELSMNQLNAPATNPPIRFMSITCDVLPWTIHISSSNTGNVLTVQDVLEGLYRGLRSKAKKTDWDNLSSDAKRRVRDAWISRYKRQQSFRQRAYEESQGLRGVDFLRGNLAFKGLTSMADSTDEHQWLLHVGPVKRTVKFRTR